MISRETSELILMGAVLGLTAGISPGPLLALVITETITKNKRAGIKVALAPLITDLPIIGVTLLAFSYVHQQNLIMGLISFLGAGFLIYLGLECFKSYGLTLNLKRNRSGSLIKGVVANILNPHPYLFWITVGTPLVLKAVRMNVMTAVVFFVAFYSMLTGSKIIIALIVEKSKAFLTTSVYIWILRILGTILFIFALIFIIQGIKSL
jgi:threonine/homoserine/homoserine lactone efflux protein